MKCRYCSRLMTDKEETHILYGPEQYCAECLTTNLITAGYSPEAASKHYDEGLKGGKFNNGSDA
jgi:hypothetical protein